jgi:protein dithiol oxidoreductase (disulfide-forming)
MRLMLILISLCMWTMPAWAAEKFQEGVNYQRISVDPIPGNAGRGEVEVIEFFSYACSHCAAFEPYIKRWGQHKPKHAKLTFVPVVFNDGWVVYAKTYYALELLGAVDKAHAHVFDAIHVRKKPAKTAEQIADIVAEAGVNRKKFLDSMNSFAVDSRLRHSAQLSQAYRLSGVPTIAVAGKYVTAGGMVGSYDQLLEVIDYLVALESKPAVKAVVPATTSKQ